ncbi:hypothetical protein GCM10009868_19290 [Terrabacter aerolatus]|uniref:DUF2530 domain-containing protein n=1 Tax=Terrabacter aerolatus TaxID=422442 RepID=A0A512D0L2_9MICO|nr:hypothetical protein [Terrabacter aerolatus]GEO29800.1 hypothetical protein TAE01_16100 [Terrabacter aerolatus]
MSDVDQTRTGGTPPKEPFPVPEGGLFIGQIREPWVMTVFFAVIAVAGVVLFVVCKKAADGGAQGALGAGWALLAMFGAVGLLGIVVGIRRWRWKHEYVRVMGRSPWA